MQVGITLSIGGVLYRGTIAPDPEYTALAWNPDDKGDDVTLSNGNLTAVNSSNSTDGVRLETFKAGGKYYCELTLGAGEPEVAAFIGVSNQNCLIDRAPGGSQPNAVFFRANGTVSDKNGQQTSAWDGWTSSGATISLAFDMDTGYCAANTDGDFSGCDFDTGTGCFELPEGDLSIHINPRADGISMPATIVSKSQEFSRSIPSGFRPLAWGEIPSISGDFAFTVSENSTYTLTTSDFTATDSDSASLTYKVISEPADGEIFVGENETYEFSHADLVAGNVDFANISTGAGSDSFRIAASDGVNVTRAETVSVTVTLADDAPVLSGTFAATCEQGLSVPITTTVLTATDSDTADGSLTYTVTSPTNGVVQVSGSTETSFTAADVKAGNVTYLNDGASAADGSFTVALSDGTTTLDTQVISISVNAAPDQVTWDSGNAHADIDLTNSDLTANNPENSLGAVMGDASKSTGKWLFAVDIDTGSTLVTTTNVGVSTSSGALDAGAGGTQSDMTVARQNGAIVSPDGTATSAWDGFSSSGGDRVYVIVDFDAGECWFGNDTDGITGDPVAGTGGSTIPAGALFPRVLPRTTGGTAGFTLVSRRMDLTDTVLDDLYADGWNAWAEGDAVALPAMTPMKADDILERIAICAHLNFSGHWDNDDWLDPFAAIGTRYIRSGLKTSNDAVTRMTYLYNTYGIKLITAPSAKSTVNGVYPVMDHGDITDAIEKLEDLPAGCLVAIEGVNEPNNTNRTSGWEDRVAAAQEHIYNESRRVHGASIPVAAPSMYRRSFDDIDLLKGALADIDPSWDFADMANPHIYTGGRRPTDIRQGHPPSVASSGAEVIDKHMELAPGKTEFIISEYGHDTRDDPDDLDAYRISSDARCQYALRGFLDYIKLGVKYICFYAAMDNTAGNSHGLYNPDGEGGFTYRPLYASIQRFLSVFSDPGADFTLTDLNIQLSGDLTDVEYLLTEKRDGTYLLAIWQDAIVWDRNAVDDVTPTPRTITVSLDDAFDVTQHKPTFTATTTSLGTGVTSFDVDALGEVVVLELTPSA